MAPRDTENNAYAKFWGDKQRALWYVMVFLEWSIKQLNTNMFTNLRTGRVIHFVLEYVKMSKLLLNADFMKKKGNCHEGQKQD